MTIINYLQPASQNIVFRNWYKTRRRRLIPMLILNLFNFAYDFLNHADLYNELSAHGPISDALSLGTKNASRDDCIWRRGGDLDPCPDPDVFYYLYTPRGADNRPRVESLALGSRSWLHASGYDPSLDSVVLVHGYAGVTDTLPIGVLRDAYIRNGSYNVFLVDWSGLARIPCYGAAVHNMKPVAKCLSKMLTFLRDSGVPVQRTTCVGHSLGAHICGITANYLLFRIHKIIGLDPARPLIRNQVKSRLDLSDADIVQIIHTSSTFGDNRQLGHVDFCINGGRIQPFCYNTTNEALCSHIRSVCYMAETLTPYPIREGVPCSRRCSVGERGRPFFDRTAPSVALGHNTPKTASGTYCVFNDDPPYCPSRSRPIGNLLCCVPPKVLSNEINDNF